MINTGYNLNIELKTLKFPAWIWPVLLGLATSYLAASFVPIPKPTATLGSGGASASTTDRISSLTKTVLDKNILGLDNPAELKAKPTKTPSTWNLVGILTGAVDMAVMRVDKDTVILREGEEYEGWVLSEIKPGYVIWKSGREQKKLVMWEQVKQLQLVRGKTNKVVVNKANAAQVLDDPNAFLSQALFKPNSENGKTQGFRITHIKSNSLLQKLGLKDGDVLLRVNGEMITGPAKMLQVYGSLAGATAISLDVKRDNQVLSLVVELK